MTPPSEITAPLEMRILLICHDSPLDRSYGAGLRTHHIWQALRAVGTVRTLIMEPSDRTVLEAPRSAEEVARIRFRKPAVPWTTSETRAIRHLVGKATEASLFDFVVVRYLRLAMLVQGSFAAPIVVDGDDLDKVAPAIGKAFARRQFDAAKTVGRRWVTRRALRRFAHVWYSNPRDMIKFPVRSGSMLPNITDAPAILLPRSYDRPAQVLMVGKFGYEPNAEAAKFFIRHVLPSLRLAAPGIVLRLVGQCPPETAAQWLLVEGVEVAGFVDDLAVEYARASIVVAPVFSGGGTQIKVLEALAHGCGVVVSEFSVAGFAPNLKAGEHVLVAHDPKEWVTQCLRLIQAPDEAERLGHKGRDVVLSKYSFHGVAREVASTFKKLGVSGR